MKERTAPINDSVLEQEKMCEDLLPPFPLFLFDPTFSTPHGTRLTRTYSTQREPGLSRFGPAPQFVPTATFSHKWVPTTVRHKLRGQVDADDLATIAKLKPQTVERVERYRSTAGSLPSYIG